MNKVEKYLTDCTRIGHELPTLGMIECVARLDRMAGTAPELASAVVEEFDAQRSNLKLIASENYSSLAVQDAMGTLFTDKYAEGYAGHRFYAGCDNVDKVERYAEEKAKELFGAENAFVQPHSGSDANLVAYCAVLNALCVADGLKVFQKKSVADLTRDEWNKVREECHNQKLLGMDYYSGGHLTHGYRQNISAQMFDCYSYGVGEDGLIDYEALRKQVIELDPLIFLVGYSAYPRKIDFHKMREIADETGAVLMVDMAHFAGLVAGKVFTGDYDPVKWADIVTMTTHKTLRGPRGGIVLCKDWLAESVYKACPIVMGGPLPHVMTAKGIALTEACRPEFQTYAAKVVKNAQALAKKLEGLNGHVLTGGTDNHMLLLDVSPFGLTGYQAEKLLRKCGITVNRNAIPNDPNGPWYTSGLRIGTPAVTTLGMDETDMEEIATLIDKVIRASFPSRKYTDPETGKSVIVDDPWQEIKGNNIRKMKSRAYCPDEVMEEVRGRVKNLLAKHPLYPELDLDYLKAEFLLK